MGVSDAFGVVDVEVTLDSTDNVLELENGNSGSYEFQVAQEGCGGSSGGGGSNGGDGGGGSGGGGGDGKEA